MFYLLVFYGDRTNLNLLLQKLDKGQSMSGDRLVPEKVNERGHCYIYSLQVGDFIGQQFHYSPLVTKIKFFIMLGILNQLSFQGRTLRLVRVLFKI